MIKSAFTRDADCAERHALLCYDTNNLGDDIQSLAALQFMPKVDELVLRDTLATPTWQRHPSGPVKIILNGWFMGKDSWPPAPQFSPLFLSFHLAQQRYREYRYRDPSSWLLEARSISYFKEHEPIGCRDLHTVCLLRAAGVDCYFSGCLTLTLRRPEALQRTNEILLVDVNAELGQLRELVPADLRQFVSMLSPLTEPGGHIRDRLMRASALLARFAQAHLVITSRLHCLLPCLAFDTPVLFVPPAESQERLEGYAGMYHKLHVERGVIISPINWEQPPQNPQLHLQLANTLSRKVTQYLSSNRSQLHVEGI